MLYVKSEMHGEEANKNKLRKGRVRAGRLEPCDALRRKSSLGKVGDVLNAAETKGGRRVSRRRRGQEADWYGRLTQEG